MPSIQYLAQLVEFCDIHSHFLYLCLTIDVTRILSYTSGIVDRSHGNRQAADLH